MWSQHSRPPSANASTPRRVGCAAGSQSTSCPRFCDVNAASLDGADSHNVGSSQSRYSRRPDKLSWFFPRLLIKGISACLRDADYGPHGIGVAVERLNPSVALEHRQAPAIDKADLAISTRQQFQFFAL
jgi:hypothetical protein